ncbi:hypothetical protein [Curvivirga sp.]|uniref:hypothetical protein n=1 Tax=Curvivirga sp. TaxID=2856848 RepID=UPI003B5B21B5
MRVLLTTIGLAVCLSGCMTLSPMELLPENEMYFMTMKDERYAPTGQNGISIQELLQSARGQDGEVVEIVEIQISYQDHVLDETNYEFFRTVQNQPMEILCGPYEYGDPFSAASMALRTCEEIRAQLNDKGISLSIRFDPNAPKGHATISPLMGEGESDA